MMINGHLNKRRDFLKNVATLGAVVSVAPQLLNAQPYYKSQVNNEGDGFTFLFQGDSITVATEPGITTGIM